MEPVTPFFNLGCIFVPLLILVVLGLVLFTVYMLFGGLNKLKDKRRDEISGGFLQEKTPTLLPWDLALALEDMSSLYVRTGESSALVGGWYHCRGTVRSLNNSRHAWLAYTVNAQKGSGNLVMRTSANQLLIDVRVESLSRNQGVADIRLDGHKRGSVDLQTMELFDELGRPLGEMTGRRGILMQGMTNYVGVEIAGREIAQMNTEPFSRLERLEPMLPVFQMLDTRLSTDEGWWLVALLAIALYRDCLSPSV